MINARNHSLHLGDQQLLCRVDGKLDNAEADAREANLPIANIAEAMGHTIEVHLGSYARFKPDATADLYAQVNA